MKNITKIAALAVVALTLAQTSQAIPISGNITFSGQSTLDAGTVGASTKVNSWSGYNVASMDGVFASSAVPTIVLNVTAAGLGNNWVFSGGSLTWAVGGFSFSSLTSVVLFNGGGALAVKVTGMISGVTGGTTFDPTLYTGIFTTQDPEAGNNAYSSSLAFAPAPAPDGACTATLLGIALSGAALLRRKLAA